MDNSITQLTPFNFKKLSLARVLMLFLGLLGFCFAITLLYLGMRSVMNVGGFCAEGGAYEIATPCPKGIAAIMPLSIFLMIGSGILYAVSMIATGPYLVVFLWTALFGSLGWNFLEFGVNPPGDESLSISWLICGVMFELMAVGPLFIMKPRATLSFLLGTNSESYEQSPKILPFTKKRTFLLCLHILAIAGGIILGVLLFNSVTK